MRLLLLFLCVYCCQAASQVANLVLLETAAQQKGAVCLDGSPGGYYFRQGIGAGLNKWIIHFEGGGWCFNEELCVERSKTSLGSSKFWAHNTTFGGLLSPNQQTNPNFYNWNVAFLNYCDGASFAGNVTLPVVHSGTTLYFRGIRITQATLDDLATKGLKNAIDVIVTGCSAGGLATYLHADYVRNFLPSSVYVKAIADAGFFLDAKNWQGQYHIRPLYQYVFKMQNCSGGVNSDCIAAANPGEEWMCFFAQYTFPHIKTPLFVLNSAYDTWQLPNILQFNCKNLSTCPEAEKEAFYNYRNVFLEAAKPVTASTTSGMFLTSCLQHCMSLSDRSWTSIKVNNTVMSEAFSTWYNGSNALHLIDCPYPCCTA
jgi:hypothetical protein